MEPWIKARGHFPILAKRACTSIGAEDLGWVRERERERQRERDGGTEGGRSLVTCGLTVCARMGDNLTLMVPRVGSGQEPRESVILK